MTAGARERARGGRRRMWGRRGGLSGLAPVVALGSPAVGPRAAPQAQAGALAAPETQMPGPLSPPMTVRVGLLASVSDSGVYIGWARGYYRELGLELDVEMVPDPNLIVTL